RLSSQIRLGNAFLEQIRRIDNGRPGQDCQGNCTLCRRSLKTMTKKLYLETVGCQMNVLDSELVVGSLRRHGYVLTDVTDDADVILFNTCSVRQHAEDKIYSALGRLRYHKNKHPDAIIGV